jgi:hypothetical protein
LLQGSAVSVSMHRTVTAVASIVLVTILSLAIVVFSFSMASFVTHCFGYFYVPIV